jgi:hypothetical protein
MVVVGLEAAGDMEGLAPFLDEIGLENPAVGTSGGRAARRQDCVDGGFPSIRVRTAGPRKKARCGGTQKVAKEWPGPVFS